MSEQQIVRVYETNDRHIIQNLQTNQMISVHRSKNIIVPENQNILNNINIYKVHKSCGILGIINLNLYNFIISISQSKKIGKIGNTEIHQIQDVEFISIEHKIEGKPFYNFDYISFEINQIITGMKKIFSEGVFFSRDFDLTNSLQSQKNIKIASNGVYNLIKHANAKYLFNNQILNPFYENNIFSSDFLVNAIYGFASIMKENINNNDISYILISRKNVFNLDLKNFSLGFDEKGNLSNAVETEQILLFGLNAFSYVQLKSPPPIKNSFLHELYSCDYDEKEIRNLNLNENLDFFLSHIDNLNKEYRFIYLINLLNKNNFHENIINNVIEHNIKNTPNTNFKYNYYNFDGMCMLNNQKNNNNNNNLINLDSEKSNSENNKMNNAKNNRDNIENFLNGIENVLSIFKFFGVTFDSQNNKNLVDQIGIIKTFCKDGLERSNIIEMRIGWLILENQLRSIKINPEEFFGADIISVKEFERMGMQTDQFLKHPKKKGIDFIIKFKKIWKENSQMLNLHFTGKNKQLPNQDLLENQDHSRIALDIDEYLRQNCLDVFLDKMPVKINTIQDSDLKKSLDENFNEYCTTKRILAFIGTYNLGGSEFKDPLDLLDWLLPDDLKGLEKLPEMYIIGLQEVVPLNASNILITSNSMKVDYWKNTLQSNLDAIGKYQLIKCLDLVGVVMLIFVKREVFERIKNFDFLIQKTGMLGTMGNKGSCLIRFELEDTSIAFSTGHFAAGQTSNASRIAELQDILTKNFTIQRTKKFQEHEIFFIFGDLNFRLDLDNNSVRRMIENKQLDTLVVYDQFIKTRNVNFSLNCLEEGNLNFNPTYKYNYGSNEYDSKAKRIPSWCDRIFFKKTKLIKQICYNRSEYTYSDHKPVYSIFDLTILRENKDEKNSLIQYFRRALTFGFEIKKKLGDIDIKEEMLKSGVNSKNWGFIPNKSGIDNINMKMIAVNNRLGIQRAHTSFNPNDLDNNHHNKIKLRANANNDFVNNNIGNNLNSNRQLKQDELYNNNNNNSNININLINLDKINLNNNLNGNVYNYQKNTNLLDLNEDKLIDPYFGTPNIGNLNIQSNNIQSHSFNNTKINSKELMNLNDDSLTPLENHQKILNASQKINEEDILQFFK